MRHIKRLIIIGIFILTNATSCSNTHDENYHMENRMYRNDILVTVLNFTGQDGYFGLCSDRIHEEGRTLCNAPQKITQGSNSIFAPAYPNAFPVFSSLQNDVYKCATSDKPDVQLSFKMDPTISKHYVIALESFVFDNNGNKIAIVCEFPH